jgi:N-methylhydantoinase B/oxoprolinase/acetone carboxylase alpha subunit
VSLDPASLQILLSRLAGVAEEMSAVLRRAAFSPNIKERADCSAALFTANGELLAQAENIPVHLGSMPASVREAVARFGPDASAADRVRPGEQVILNDPFAGGTHLNDVTVVSPCFAGVPTRLVGWAATRAHHADVGGSAPGSIPADATEIFAEGLRIPPVRLTPEVRALLLANSRTPGERSGDLDAQVGANEVGIGRLATLADEPFAEVLDYGERRMTAALHDLPDGTWQFTDVIDSYGSAPAQQVETEITVAMTIDGGGVTFDFTGSGPQRAGNVNAVESVTVSAVAFALRAAVDPTLPANGGTLRPLTVIAPTGTIVNAQPPAAVGAGNVEVSQRVADVCFGALALARPGLIGAASQGTMNNLLIGGIGGGTGATGGSEPWVYYETLAGGQGGRPFRRGMSGVHTHMTNTSQAATGGTALTGPGTPGQSGIHTNMTNTRNTPIEALERAFPLRVLRYRLRQGSGGTGSAPGGEGIERDVQVLEDATVSIITERRVSQPWGLDGGGPGAVGENWLLRGGDERRAERLLDKCTIQLKAGDVLRMLTPGGGGWGKAISDGGT